MADDVQPLFVAAALSRTLARVLEEVEAVDDDVRASAIDLADRIQAALEASPPS